MAVTYRQAGVDIDLADSLIERIKPLAAKTRTSHVLEGIGGFAGLAPQPARRHGRAYLGQRYRRRGHQVEGRVAMNKH